MINLIADKHRGTFLMTWPVRLALACLVFWVVVSVIAVFAVTNANAININAILLPPSMEHWLGTDDLGRSMLARLLVGGAVSLVVALMVVSVGAVIGMTMGMIAGYFGGLIDRVVVYFIDVFLAFPGILLAIALAGLLGAGLGNIIIALAAVGWVGYARLARAQVLSLKQQEFIVAAKAMGVHPAVIIKRHVLPGIKTPMLVEASFSVAAVIVAEAGLSFLGLGIQPPLASWGAMIRDGSRYLLIAPHMVLVPGGVLVVIVVSINIVGDWLRDQADVKNR